MAPATVAENRAMVRAAAEALGRLGDPEALWSLMGLAEERSEPELVGPAAEAIGRIGTDVATQFLADLALEEDAAKRICAAGGLEELGDPEATELLWSLLRDADPGVRQRAVRALGRRPLGEVEPGLRVALLADQEGRRGMALEVLQGQLSREGLEQAALAGLAQWVRQGEASPQSAAWLAPVLEALARARARLASGRAHAAVSRAVPPAPAAPTRTLAAESDPDGIPVYRPLRHRVLGEGEEVSLGAARAP